MTWATRPTWTFQLHGHLGYLTVVALPSKTSSRLKVSLSSPITTTGGPSPFNASKSQPHTTFVAFSSADPLVVINQTIEINETIRACDSHQKLIRV